MKLALRFLGAAENVTGSRFLVDANGKRILVDCGLYQERKFRHRNWDPFHVPASSIDAVLLTHGHLDHCGLLPKLVREGFDGPIYCTPATADIAGIVIRDSARIQEEDAAYKRKRHAREGRRGPHPEAPLYTVADADRCIPLFEGIPYKQSQSLGDGLAVTFHEGGHILGSSMVTLAVTQEGDTRTLLFSGDVGRWDLPILRDPTQFEHADYVLVESTYGERIHKPTASIEDELARVVNETYQAGGNIIIPSFAVERTQELLYHLNALVTEKRIPHIAAFVDSPMAVKVTEVFKKHPELFDEEAMDLLRSGNHPCDFRGLQMSRSVAESKAINSIRGTAIVIAGSGMCTGGRIKHHLKSNISRPESTILFVGYQAVGTLGRLILDGEKRVRIHGQQYDVAARIEKLGGFSAHADRDELYRWLSSLKEAPREVFVVHGEEDAAASFCSWLHQKTGWSTTVPTYEQTVTLT